MQRSRAAKHLLHLLRRIAATQAENHAGDERGEFGRVFEVARKLRIEPVARADREHREAAAVVVADDRAVTRKARRDLGVNSLPPEIAGRVELPGIPHGLDVPGRSRQRNTIAIARKGAGPRDVDRLLKSERDSLAFQAFEFHPKMPRLLPRPKSHRVRLAPHHAGRAQNPRSIRERRSQFAARVSAVAETVQRREDHRRDEPASGRSRAHQQERAGCERQREQHTEWHRPPIRRRDPEQRRKGEAEERKARAELGEKHRFPIPKGGGDWRVVVDTGRARAKTSAATSHSAGRAFHPQLQTPNFLMFRAIKRVFIWLGLMAEKATENDAINAAVVERGIRDSKARADKAGYANGQLAAQSALLKEQIKKQTRQKQEIEGLLQAAVAANDEENGAHYAEELAGMDQDIADNQAQLDNLETLYKQNTEIIGTSIKEIQRFEREFEATKARVAVSRQLEGLAGLMKSSVSEMQGMLGGETAQSMQQLRQSAASGEGQMRATMDIAREVGSGVARQQEVRKARGKLLFDQYKQKMGMVQPEAAAPAKEATPPERQKIAE